jgi:hypothetical protein
MSANWVPRRGALQAELTGAWKLCAQATGSRTHESRRKTSMSADKGRHLLMQRELSQMVKVGHKKCRVR